jgi:hypothetical protein
MANLPITNLPTTSSAGAVSVNQAIASNPQLATFLNKYPDIGNAAMNGTLNTKTLMAQASRWSTMLNGIYRVSDQPLYDTQTLSAGTVNQDYVFFQTNYVNSPVGNISNMSGQGSLPISQAFLIEKIQVSLRPTVFSGYQFVDTAAVTNDTNIIPTNIEDQWTVTENAWIEVQFLDSIWIRQRIVFFMGGPSFKFNVVANTALSSATIAVGDAKIGPESLEAMPPLREKLFLAPQENFTVKLRFPTTAPTIVNNMNVTIAFLGKNYQSAS